MQTMKRTEQKIAGKKSVLVVLLPVIDGCKVHVWTGIDDSLESLYFVMYSFMGSSMN